jgi:hypothetical protein
MRLLPAYKCPHCGSAVSAKILLKYPVPCGACQRPIQVKASNAAMLGAAVMATVGILARYNYALAAISVLVVSFVGVRLLVIEPAPPSQQP